MHPLKKRCFATLNAISYRIQRGSKLEKASRCPELKKKRLYALSSNIVFWPFQKFGHFYLTQLPQTQITVHNCFNLRCFKYFSMICTYQIFNYLDVTFLLNVNSLKIFRILKDFFPNKKQLQNYKYNFFQILHKVFSNIWSAML